MRRWTVSKLNESGYDEALYGLSLSHGADLKKMPDVLRSLAFRGGGHSKALESIQTWWTITMPRYWWAEEDTYRVSTTKQSASTMHTIHKRILTQEDFIEPILYSTLIELNSAIVEYSDLREWIKYCSKDSDKKTVEERITWLFRFIKRNLPEGFLQTREVNINYMTLQNIMKQRKHHKLQEWWDFCGAVLLQVDHSDLLVTKEDYDFIVNRYTEEYNK